MIKTAQILIPSGRPPVDLTPSLWEGTDGENTFNVPASELHLGEDLGEEELNLLRAMEEGAHTGLSDGSEALSEALTGKPKAKGGAKQRKGDPTLWRPEHFSDEDLTSWAKACREKHASGWLKVSALKYWLRYTFDSYTPEYKELGKRLEEVVK
jgi:hypothetical protein